MADIDPNAIPFVPDTSVALIEPESGKPKTAFHDWMQSLYDWMKRSVVDLTTKVTTLTADIGGLSAQIVEEATIRQTEDGILAAQITSVEAKADDATANGEIYFAAKAAPSGATAAYGIYLSAGNYYAGLEIIATSGGGSAIGMAASQFRFTDSGTAQQVFNYSGGVFTFMVPIVIQSGTSGARKVSTAENDKIYDSGNTLRVAIGVDI